MMTFRTADLCDEHAADVRICTAPFRSFGSKRSFCGPIQTVRTHEDAGLIRQCLQTPGQGRILVVDGGGSTRAAVLGDMLAGHAVRNGWQAVVVFGAVRDTDALAALDLGVIALGTTPRRGALDGKGEIGVTLTLGDACFVPGHHLYYDADGLIVSDRALPDQVEESA
ncbi:ribonuclease E activity regulator RraA [Paracoccus pantotrophus]|uniref:ribonuclease E activity regulator RraA n=1 Tax=Paracoccus pantotrophus TaxID=82367 RepID=UPI0008ECA572|nr:ribonuclease E activity regulator RraA [Paracoccus pantotrophus]MDF3856235.1 ribonuclease E activity regulator RraA [Paracoccus pantotrophus]SFP02734.1 regulator of ribonuclease activity A [Paracoccus pantotrophus]